MLIIRETRVRLPSYGTTSAVLNFLLFYILRMLECMGHTIVKLKNPELEFLLVLYERKDVLPQLVFRRF